MNLRLLLPVTACMVLWGRAAFPSCGIDVCPAPTIHRAVPQDTLVLPQAVRATQVSEGPLSARFVETLVRAEYRWAAGWTLGVMLPLVVRDVNGTLDRGLGNPVVLMEGRIRAAPIEVRAGAQLEVPLGDAELGMASPHAELLPYVRARLAGDVVGAFGELAMRWLLADGEGHGRAHRRAMVQLNPHSESEVLYRGGVAAEWFEHRFMPRVYLSGVRILRPGLQAADLIDVGADGTVVVIADRFDVRLHGEMPLSEARRFDWRAGATAAVRF